MNANNVDIYVLLKTETAHAEFDPVVENIGKVAGVRKARINDHVPSLMAVMYDPMHIDSQTILASIRQQGYHASLIGM